LALREADAAKAGAFGRRRKTQILTSRRISRS
jgi:hypothetical protein